VHIAYALPDWIPASHTDDKLAYVQQLREALVGLGHKVTVLSPNGILSSEREAFAETSLPVRGRFREGLVASATGRLAKHAGIPARMAETIQALHARMPLDLVEMEESYGWSRFVQDRIDVPLVTRLYAPQFLTAARALNRAEAEASARRACAEGTAILEATALSSPTQKLLDASVTKYGAKTPLKAVVANPTTPALEGSLWSEAACDPFAFLMLGCFDRVGAADVAIEALEIVLRVEPRASLKIVGSDRGLQDESGRTLGFDEYCAAHVPASVRERIALLPVASGERIANLHRNAYATLVPSRSEGFSYGAAQAMALGCPIVISRSCNADLIQDGATGLLVEVNSAKDLADKMLYMLRNKCHAAEMGRSGWERCRRAFAPGVVADKVLSFYIEVLRCANVAGIPA
jgi:glycosyltransferase involved in cell wall biosynthesis